MQISFAICLINGNEKVIEIFEAIIKAEKKKLFV